VKNTLKNILIIIAIFSCLIFLGFKSYSKSVSDNPLFLINVDGKYGYINKSGKIIVKPQYDEAAEFSEGLAEVSNCSEKPNKNGYYIYQYRYINKQGKEVIYPDFHYETKTKGNIYIDSKFSNGLAKFPISNKWGYIDKSGKFAIKPQFDYAEDFSDSIAAVQIKDKWGYINKKGDFVIKPEFDYAQNFIEGIGIVGFYNKDGNGAVNNKGKFVIPLGNDQLVAISEGIMTVFKAKKLKTGETDYSCVYTDKKLNVILDPQKHGYSSGIDDDGDHSNFSDGLLLVSDKDWNWLYINKSGKVAFRTKLQGFPDGHDAPLYNNFSEGLNNFYTENGKEGFIDKKGKIAIKPIFDSVAPFKNGLAKAKIGNKEGYIDKTGKFVWYHVNKSGQ
jgi:hypothetical protein